MVRIRNGEAIRQGDFKCSYREVEARVQGHSLSLSEFEANLDHTIPFLKNKFPQRREAGFRINLSEVNVNKGKTVGGLLIPSVSEEG